MFVYTIKDGDTIEKLSREFNVSLDDLLLANGITEDAVFPVGTAVVIPTDYGRHIIEKGDSLYSIALKYGTTVENLLRLNPNLKPPYIIYPNDYIIVPSYAEKPRIDTNGYCYTSISDETLDKTLPYLTYISIFSYNLLPDGNLKGIDDERIIRHAREQNVAPFMVVTNIGDKGNFDSELVKTFLTTPDAYEAFIDGIPTYLKERGYLGINIDFEYVYAENREDYNNFIKLLSQRLSSEGLMLSTALAPKLSDTQKGILYEGHDYAFLGEWCDWIAIMTYEWGYIAGPPLAVAPKSEVEKVIRYTTSVIPSEKILLGMPNYGYDWTLPFERGTKAQTVNLTRAIQLAREVGANIEYNTSSNAPFFTYNANGRDHIVWFDDARSIMSRFELVNKYDLGGISFWTINNYFAPTFAVLQNMFEVNKLL